MTGGCLETLASKMPTACCDRCRAPLAMPGVGDQCTTLNSYVVLDPRRGSAGATASALPELVASTPATGSSDMAQAATLHESLRTVSRLLELSELLHETSPSTACGVPLCSDCGNAIQGELQRRLEEAHAEREMLQAAFAELEGGTARRGREAESSSRGGQGGARCPER